jgi:hypothetical protein
MTDRHDSLRSAGGARGEERLLRESLRGFHTCVSAEDAIDPARLARWLDLASPRLCQATDVDLTMEAAWALLARWEGASASDDVAVDDDVSRTLVRGLIATMPPLIKWLRYVERFPSGEAMEGFRRHRRETILRWYPHVHPDPSTLAEYVHADPALPALVRAGISAHLQGPYICFACRNAERTLSPASQRAEASQRLIAATAADEPHKREAIVKVRGTEYRFRVSFLADGGFLRVFASYEGERTPPTISMRLAVLFGSGQLLEGSIVYPDHGLLGANLGPLQGLSIGDIVSCSLEP